MKDKKKNHDENADSENDFGGDTANDYITEKSEKNNTTAKSEAGKITEKPEKKRIFKSVISGALAGLLFVAVFFAGYFTHYFSIDKDLRSIDFILDIYNKYYYNPSEGKKESPQDILVDGLMDIYSDYYSPEEYKKILQEDKGIHEGYGFALYVDSFKIHSVAGNSPAEKAGVKAGGDIISYQIASRDNVKIEAIDVQKFLADIREVQSGGEIVLEIRYDGDNNIKEHRIKKEKYNENYVYYTDSSGSYAFFGDYGKEMELKKIPEEYFKPDVLPQDMNPEWAYLKFTGFGSSEKGNFGSDGQFETALNKFKENGNHKLIIDLRGNGGGFVSVLCDIASHLCPDASGKKFVCQNVVYKDGKTEHSMSKRESDYESYGFQKIVFLADSGTASASEALMGAVLDYDKKSGKNIVNVVLEPLTNASGNLVNEKGEILKDGENPIYRSYGKGIMQKTYEGGAIGTLKLTVAEIHWPISETCIHKAGLTPSLLGDEDNRIKGRPIGEDALAFAQSL